MLVPVHNGSEHSFTSLISPYLAGFRYRYMNLLLLVSLFTWGRYKQWTWGPQIWDQGTHEDPVIFGILYTSQYSILVLGTSASSFAWPIHCFPIMVSHIMFIPIIISTSEKVYEADCIYRPLACCTMGILL